MRNSRPIEPLKRGGIYVRLSQASDDPTKLGDQVEMCRKLAAAHSIEIVDVYEDDGISAFTGKDRPGWNRMLLDVQAGKLDVVLAQSEDRFARRVAEKEMLALLCVAHRVTWLTLNDGATDPSTADGEYFSITRAATARMESRRKAERQAQRNAEMRARGELPRGGRRPFGYWRVVTITDDGSTRVVEDELHPDEAALVSWAYERCLAAEGTGLSAIRTHFNRVGATSVNGNPFDLPKIEKILRRARNAGLVEHKLRGQTWPQLVRDGNGDLVRGRWPTIVPEDVYFAVLAKLDDPTRRLHAPRPAHHLLSSIASCTCGVKLRVAGRDNGTVVYRCGVHDGAAHKIPGVKHVSVRCEDLDDLVTREVVHALMFAPRLALPDLAADQLESLHVALTKNRQAQQIAAVSIVDPELAHMASAIRAEAIRLGGAERELQRDIDEIKRSNAHAALLHDLSTWVVSGPGRVDLDADAALAVRLIERFRSLGLDDRRALVRAYVDVRVHNGRRLDGRVEITHKIATALNGEEGA